jgi:23S rRNA (cytosine1962-C5)-methyltransferase
MTGLLDRETLGALLANGTDTLRLLIDGHATVDLLGSSLLVSTPPGGDPHPLASRAASILPAPPTRVFHRTLVTQPGASDSPRLVSGDASMPPTATVHENHLAFEVDFSSGYNPGFFADQRDNRAFLRSFLADRPAPRVLNTFAHTCAFTVAAAAEGASTLSVDVSKASLQRGRRNLALNPLPAANHRFITEDAPALLARLARRGETFDAIILDPPTFGRAGRHKTFRFERDLPTLLEAARAVAAPQAAILVSTNASSWPPARLAAAVSATLPEASIHALPPPPDFAAAPPSTTLWALDPLGSSNHPMPRI